MKKIIAISGLTAILYSLVTELSTKAADVNFNVNVANSCTVTKLADGTMTYDTAEGDLNEGIPGTFSVTSTTANATLTITPPSIFSVAPANYTGTPSFQYRYGITGANTISLLASAVNSTRAIALTLPGVNTGTLYSGVTNSGGAFVSGNYTAVYTVTCS